MTTTTNPKTVLETVKTTLGRRRPPKLMETTCRHPPSEQSVLILEDRALHGCEWCGELLNRRPHPLPEIDAPVQEYESTSV